MPESQDTAGAEVRLVFRPLADTVPWPHRVRRLLKFALRFCNLRCVRLENLPPQPADAVPGSAPGASGTVETANPSPSTPDPV